VRAGIEITVLWIAALASPILGCKRADPAERGKRILHLAARSKVSSLDPARCNSQYDNLVVSLIYEPLLQYHSTKRPYTLEPNLLASMPKVSEDSLSYDFTLKPGVFFQDDPAFGADGRGREMTAEDVVYSIKRMANKALLPTGWWIYGGHIVGFDAFKQRQSEGRFDVDAPVEGLEVVDRLRFRIRLVRPFPQLLHVLATCYASVVPREAEERYGPELGRHPVGTGPFRLAEIVPGTQIRLERNLRHREETSPSGKRVPPVDGMVIHIFEQDQPMWLKWRVKDLDFIQTPSEYFDAAFDGEGELRRVFAEEGVGWRAVPKLDFIYRGFNMSDPIVGGFGRGKLVRQAIALALDTAEVGDAFYNRTAVAYDGPIPPGLEGHDPGVISPYRGPMPDEAKAKLAEAGYPEGRGLPVIEFHANRGGNTPEQAEMIARQLAAVGVRISVLLHSFSELDDLLRKRKAQMFTYSWGSDYPDAENNLALFYGPNADSGGVNYFEYRNPEYDALYERIRTMSPSSERTALYRRMRDIVIEDCPAIASMARTRYFVWNKRVHDLEPDETFYTWLKYADVDPLE
jgi:peptide/nickel transport system substrate-binding protein